MKHTKTKETKGYYMPFENGDLFMDSIEDPFFEEDEE